ncbi:MAG: formylglycine-generating enzyme family protein [Bacteroidales bacterium]|nr:formylglycine-generating enzyme family protein [Bacteroidales bacterium]
MQKTIICLVFIVSIAILLTTTMTVHTTSGDHEYDISEITSITFDTGQFQWCSIPAGDFTWGEDDEIQSIDYEYQIMKNEVTNQQYVNYLVEALLNGDIIVSTTTVEGYYEGDEQYSAGNYAYLNMDGSEYCRIDWTGSEFTIESEYENHPVVEVTWFGAWAFAEHYGFRLPTEEEWEKAARGMTGFDYPWGDDLDGSRANYWNSGDPFDNDTTPVGYYNGSNYNGFQTTDSPSPYDLYDMAGNVNDWTDSWWSPGSSGRVYRGGAWHHYSDDLESWYRNGSNSDLSQNRTGFRCAKNP